MPENWIIKQTIDLSNAQTSPVIWPDVLMVGGDKDAHTWEISVKRNGMPVDLTGAIVTCYIIRPRLEEALVILGSVNGNALSATFPKEAYYYEGSILAVMKYADAQGAVITAATLYAQVKRTIPSTVIDPGGEIVSLEEMLALYYAMERQINAVENIQISASTLLPGSQATAEVDHTDLGLSIALGIPEGAQGETGTIEIVDTVTVESGVQAFFEEAKASTAQERKYIAHIPKGETGNALFATFAIDMDTRELVMRLPDEYKGPRFGLNHANRTLEVILGG